MTICIHKNYDCDHLSTLGLQSKASRFISATTTDQILESIRYAARKASPIVPIGSGSNVVLPKLFEGVLLQVATGGMEVVEEDASSATVLVQAGESWHEFVLECSKRGWHGLENLAYIPGTVGATPIQNIGAYGVEVEQFVRSVRGFRVPSGQAFSLNKAQCNFAYRDSIFKQSLKNETVITAVEFQLSKNFSANLEYPALADYLIEKHVKDNLDPNESISADQRSILLNEVESRLSALELIDAVVAIRRSKLPEPSVEANAGSFFKNPLISTEKKDVLIERFPGMPFYLSGNQVKVPAAWLIESCDLKGYEEGGLAMSASHALVLLHKAAKGPKPSNADDVLAFSKKIVAGVKSKFDLVLETEPRFI